MTVEQGSESPLELIEIQWELISTPNMDIYINGKVGAGKTLYVKGYVNWLMTEYQDAFEHIHILGKDRDWEQLLIKPSDGVSIRHASSIDVFSSTIKEAINQGYDHLLVVIDEASDISDEVFESLEILFQEMDKCSSVFNLVSVYRERPRKFNLGERQTIEVEFTVGTHTP